MIYIGTTHRTLKILSQTKANTPLGFKDDIICPIVKRLKYKIQLMSVHFTRIEKRWLLRTQYPRKVKMLRESTIPAKEPRRAVQITLDVFQVWVVSKATAEMSPTRLLVVLLWRRSVLLFIELVLLARIDDPSWDKVR